MSNPEQNQQNVYTANQPVGAEFNPLMPAPDVHDEAFAESANTILLHAIELMRALIGSHQAAAAIVIGKDWRYVRKFFSLSDKYAAWKDYKAPATGYGTHGWLLHHNQPVRFTQAELEAHPAWKNFGTEASAHPPMRGWMAAPITGSDGTNWGLLQLSDKYDDADYTKADEVTFVAFTQLISIALELAWEKRNLTKGLSVQPKS